MFIQLRAMTHDGRPHLSWPGELIAQGSSWTAVRAEKGAVVTHHTKNIEFRLDHISVGLFSFSEFFNVMYDYDEGGELIRLYVNVASPARLVGDVLEWNDYHLDVLVDSAGVATVVDVDEFDAAVEAGAYKPHEAARFRAIADELKTAATFNRFPLVRATYDEFVALLPRG